MAIDIASQKPSTLIGIVKSVYTIEGMRGFYSGIVPSLFGIVPYHGTGFFMFHLLKGILIEKMPDWRQSKIFDFIFGAIGGLSGQIGKRFY